MEKLLSFENSLLDAYFKIIKIKFPGINHFFNTENSEFFDIFEKVYYKVLKNYSIQLAKKCITKEKKLDIDIDEDFQKEQYIRFTEEFRIKETIKYACIHSLTIKNEDSEKFLNETLQNNINDTVRKFQTNNAYAKKTLKYYYCYLKSKFLNPNFSLLEDAIYDENKWLINFENYKGYITINDILRDVLLDISLGYINDKSPNFFKEYAKRLDEYFSTSKYDFFLQNKFSTVLDEPTIKAYKNYQIALIFSDAYMSLKSAYLNDSETSLSESEIKLLEFIEDALNDKDFSCFENIKNRSDVYAEFWVNTSASINIRRNTIKFLEDNEETKTLKMGNPIYFLE